MSHTVLTVSSTTLSEMKTHYASQAASKLPTGAVFTAKTAACTITGYRSGKVLFQGKDALQEAAKWQGETAKAAPAKQKNRCLPYCHLGSLKCPSSAVTKSVPVIILAQSR